MSTSDEREIAPGVYMTDFRPSKQQNKSDSKQQQSAKAADSKQSTASTSTSVAAAAAAAAKSNSLSSVADADLDAAILALDASTPMNAVTAELILGGADSDLIAVQTQLAEITRLRAKLIESNTEIAAFIAEEEAEGGARDPDWPLAIKENDSVIARYSAQIKMLQKIVDESDTRSASAAAAARRRAAGAAAATAPAAAAKANSKPPGAVVPVTAPTTAPQVAGANTNASAKASASGSAAVASPDADGGLYL